MCMVITSLTLIFVWGMTVPCKDGVVQTIVAPTTAIHVSEGMLSSVMSSVEPEASV